MKTKTIIITGFLTTCHLLAASAFAGHEIGNGGGAWVCQSNDAPGTIRWAKLVDLYEARMEFGLTIPNVGNRDHLEIIENIMVRRLFPVSEDLYRSVNDELEAVKSRLVPVEAELEVIGDALFRIRPSKRECAGGTVSYVQLANYTNYGKILIQKTLFEDPRLNETDKAALLIHEAVYAYLRNRNADKNSVRARKIVGLLFSTLPQKELQDELEKILDVSLSPLGMNFVRVHAGSFMMGSPVQLWSDYNDEEEHPVRLTNDYEMQTTQVTQKQYFDVMGVNPSRFKNPEDCPKSVREVQGRSGSVTLCPNHPVETVSWYDAQAFVEALNTRRKDGYVYRLPTEAEWEFAARAGTTSAYSFGNSSNQLPLYGWFDANSGGKTHEVGQLRPNAFGLYDMHGNVWQWVQDWYAKDYGSTATNVTTDPQGPSRGTYRVMRGGSSLNAALSLRVAYRSFGAPDGPQVNAGFRLARSRGGE